MTISIGTAIRRARETAGQSQDALAYLIGADRNYISRIENGHIVPKLEQIVRIAVALETRTSTIIEYAETYVHAHPPQSVRCSE